MSDIDYGSWAHRYNGYTRLAGPQQLGAVTEQLRNEYDATGVIPEWAGVDLLRGWAFLLVRAHRHGGGYRPLTEEFPQIVAIADAVDRHPEATDADRPPTPERP